MKPVPIFIVYKCKSWGFQQRYLPSQWSLNTSISKLQFPHRPVEPFYFTVIPTNQALQNGIKSWKISITRNEQRSLGWRGKVCRNQFYLLWPLNGFCKVKVEKSILWNQQEFLYVKESKGIVGVYIVVGHSIYHIREDAAWRLSPFCCWKDCPSIVACSS